MKAQTGWLNSLMIFVSVLVSLSLPCIKIISQTKVVTYTCKLYFTDFPSETEESTDEKVLLLEEFADLGEADFLVLHSSSKVLIDLLTGCFITWFEILSANVNLSQLFIDFGFITGSRSFPRPRMCLWYSVSLLAEFMSIVRNHFTFSGVRLIEVDSFYDWTKSWILRRRTCSWGVAYV